MLIFLQEQNAANDICVRATAMPGIFPVISDSVKNQLWSSQHGVLSRTIRDGYIAFQVTIFINNPKKKRHFDILLAISGLSIAASLHN